jgi:hypothetical protein
MSAPLSVTMAQPLRRQRLYSWAFCGQIYLRGSVAVVGFACNGLSDSIWIRSKQYQHHVGINFRCDLSHSLQIYANDRTFRFGCGRAT